MCYSVCMDEVTYTFRAADGQEISGMSCHAIGLFGDSFTKAGRAFTVIDEATGAEVDWIDVAGAF